jgi:hypothetical protein
LDGRGDLQDGERGRDGDMMHDEVADDLSDRLARDLQVFENVQRERRTVIGLLVGDDFAVFDEAMFEIVDADGGCFAESHRTEMAGNFEVARVRGFDRGGEFGPRDVHVSLQGSGARVGPVFNEGSRVGGAAQLEHLRSEAADPFEVAGGDVQVWPGVAAVVNPLLHHEVGVIFEAATGTRP